MGGSSSKVEPVVGPDALPEWYVANPALSSNRLSRSGNLMISTVDPPPPYTAVAGIPHFHRSNRQGDVFDSHILPPSRRNGNNPYRQRFDDEDEEMIRFVSMMSLAETRSPAQPSTVPRPRQPRARASQPNLKAMPRRHAITTGDGGSISRNTPRRPALKASSLAMVTQSTSSDEEEFYGNIDRDFTRRLPSVQEARSRTPAYVERPVSRLQQMQECSICIETKPANEFPKVTSKCRHKATTCLTCLRAWISSELTALTWNKLKCFSDGCNAVLAYNDMKKHATPDVFEKYDHFSMLSVISTFPNFRWCSSPRCKSGQIHVSGTDGPIFRCIACGTKSCIIHHNVPWHEGMTCKEYDNDYRRDPKKKKREEAASKKLMEESTKRCPGRNCGAPIEKSAGCDHMTCAKCKHEFCWLCLADYNAIRSKGNAMHKSTCSLHSNRLR